MKKCPQCGNDIPLDSVKCSYCGYSSEKITKSYSYGKSPDKKGPPGQQPVDVFGNKFVVYIILIFFAVIFLFFLYIWFDFSSFFDFMHDVKKYEEEPCLYVCKDGYSESNGYCYCDNGDVFDENGNKVNNDENNFDSSKIHLSPLNLDEWERDVIRSEYVVTVICEKDEGDSYTLDIYDSALVNNYKLYIFNIEQLSISDQNNLINYFDNLELDHLDYPITLVSRNNHLYDYKCGVMSKNDLDFFLRRLGVY